MSVSEPSHLLLSLFLWTAICLSRTRLRAANIPSDVVCLVVCEVCYLAAGWGHLTSSHLLLAGHAALLSGVLVFQSLYNWACRSTGGQDEARTDHVAAKPWAKPTIIPSRTNHIRLTPKKHSFSYSYLFVGVPVGHHGRLGYALSVDSPKKAFLSVRGADHLQPGGSKHDLRQKLDDYLATQGRSGSDFPFAYLVTAPRVLGHSFNPVSFWYLYSPDRVLMAMILEVNNTFGERRPYLLDATLAFNNGTKQSGTTFSTSWAKDFHVSPFNDRQGSYSLVAQDPGLGTSDVVRTVSNTITLLSPTKEPKLVARVFASQVPLDVSSIGWRTAIWLIARYGWVGFVTFPRILREASKLYFKRSLDLWFRPEVNRGSYGRDPTDIERSIETVFKDYLAARVKEHGKQISISYKAAPGINSHHECYYAQETFDTQPSITIELEILTPAFYSRIPHYSSLRDVVHEEALCDDSRNRTMHVSDPEGLTALLDSNSDRQIDIASVYQGMSLSSRLRWELLRIMRCQPPSQSFRNEETSSAKNEITTQVARFTTLDHHAAQHRAYGEIYRRNVTQLFLAQRYAGGFAGLISLMDLLVRVMLIVLGVHSALNSFASLGMTQGHTSKWMTNLMLLNAVHGWSFLKGVSAPRSIDGS